MESKNGRPLTEAELVAKGDPDAKARVEAEAKLKADKAKADADAKAKADAEAKAKAYAKAKAAAPLGEQLKAAVSPENWAQVEAILATVEADPSLAAKQKAIQQLSGYYTGKLFDEIKKKLSK